jgi:glyoxylase-like metal-dependent hydrolase (beta-lactamase superfamily II)
MRIRALTAGAVRVNARSCSHTVARGGSSTRSCPALWSDPMPIHCWAIEHQGRLRLIDTGETVAARNLPFARFEVAREQELPAAIAAAGLSLEEVSEVVLTHHHGDHVNGLVHVGARASVADVELRFVATAGPRVMRRVLRLRSSAWTTRVAT